MARIRTLVACVAAGLLGAGVVVAVVAAPAPAPVGKGEEKWEYGELQCGYTSPGVSKDAGGGRLEHPGKATIRWMTRKVTVEVAIEVTLRDLRQLMQRPEHKDATFKTATEAVAWEQMVKKLKVPAPDKGAAKLPDRMRVFNHLGEEGWELAAYQPGSEREKTLDIWTFKRKAK